MKNDVVVASSDSPARSIELSLHYRSMQRPLDQQLSKLMTSVHEDLRTCDEPDDENDMWQQVLRERYHTNNQLLVNTGYRWWQARERVRVYALDVYTLPRAPFAGLEV